MFSQIQVQKQQTKILPQQIQMLNIFHLNTIELDQRISEEVEDNVLLEMNPEDETIQPEKFTKEETVQDYESWDEHGYDDVPDYKLEYENYFNNQDLPNMPIKAKTNFRESLKEQICFADLSETDLHLANYVIDSLDNNGFLRQDINDMVDDLSFRQGVDLDVAKLENVISEIKKLEPVGVGSRDARECLLLQLNNIERKGPDVKKAIQLLRDHYDELSHRNMEKIKKILQVDDEEIRIIFRRLSLLNVKPVVEDSGSQPENRNIIPDFLLTVDENDNIEVDLYKQRSSSLYINHSLIDSVKSSGNKDKSAIQYLKSKLNSAKWFVNAIRQRENTMLQIMKAIVGMQPDYFLSGDVSHLKPMILKNVADKIGVEISTVSRVTSNKYVDTPFGIILLKNLFTEGIINKKGEVISNRVIQSAIENVIESEDKSNPYTDQQLVAILADKSISVARRTIAKYREQLQIPMAQFRRMLA
jgi:RNA polymerase sigma-54 factor